MDNKIHIIHLIVLHDAFSILRAPDAHAVGQFAVGEIGKDDDAGRLQILVPVHPLTHQYDRLEYDVDGAVLLDYAVQVYLVCIVQ